MPFWIRSLCQLYLIILTCEHKNDHHSKFYVIYFYVLIQSNTCKWHSSLLRFVSQYFLNVEIKFHFSVNLLLKVSQERERRGEGEVFKKSALPLSDLLFPWPIHHWKWHPRCLQYSWGVALPPGLCPSCVTQNDPLLFPGGVHTSVTWSPHCFKQSRICYPRLPACGAAQVLHLIHVNIGDRVSPLHISTGKGDALPVCACLFVNFTILMRLCLKAWYA